MLDIKGYEGKYAITKDGQVWSHKREKFLKPETTNCGYLRVGLSKDGALKHYSLHRLVAEAYLPNPNNLPQVNHKDHDRTNNNVENLEWCTQEYNNAYSNCVEAMAATHKKKVKQLSKSGELLKVWDSCADAEKALKIKNIYRGANGTRKTVGGYRWEYV